MTTGDPAIPVNVLTGFLGSGKTTLLRHLLSSPAFAEAAVLVNELGEVGLDHLVLRRLDESAVLLQGGCICCMVRQDLRETIRTLHSQRERGVVPPFDRLLVETTGLADPTPILATVMSDPVIRHHFRLGNVIATVDAVHGDRGLDRHPELRKQAALADRLVVTKVDITAPQAVARLVGRLRTLNPTAVIREAIHGVADASLILGQDVHTHATKTAEVRAWLAQALDEADRHVPGHDHVYEGSRHDGDIRASVIELEEPVEWAAFALWLSLLVSRHGDKLLRLKAILNVEGSETPVVVHSVQHLVHPPEHLPVWPTVDHQSRVIIIGQWLDPEVVARSLWAFLRIGAKLRAETETGEAISR